MNQPASARACWGRGGARLDQLLGLRVFCRVVERGSFSAVGREFGLAQPTVSRLVAEVEQRLGVLLLVRTTRKVRPTEQGQALYERVSRAVSELLEAEREVVERRGALAGKIRVSAPGAFGKRFVVPVVNAFLAEHPGVRVELLLGDRPVDLVQAGVDLAIRIGAPSPGHFTQRKLVELTQLLVASTAYLEARGEPTSLEGLAGHAALFHEDTRAHLAALQEQGGLPPLPPFDVRLLSDDIEAVREAARAGLGLAPLSAWLVAEDLAAGRLRRVLPAFAGVPARVVVVLPPSEPPARVAAFLERLGEHVRGEVARLDAMARGAGA